MSKVRVYEVAKQLNLEPKAVVALFQAVGVLDVKNHMSSVDGDAIERVKRHIEKQKNPQPVVEERIRPTVVKRRAAVKVESQVALPPAPPSSVAMVSVEKDRRSGASLDAFVAKDVAPFVPEAIIPEARSSQRDVASTRDVAAAARKSDIALPPSSRRDVASTRDVTVPADRESKPFVAAAAIEEAPASSKLPVQELLPPPPPPVEAAVEVAKVPAVAKTGVEYWTGRPGVPMAPPAKTSPVAPRRVQYDPKTGTTSNPGMRPTGGNFRPGQAPGRPMHGRPGGSFGSFRRPGQQFVPSKKAQVTMQEMSAHKKVIRIEESITLSVMAQRMSMKATELLMKLLSMGTTGIHINSLLDADTAKILASEFGWEVENVAKSDDEALALAVGDELEEGVETTEGGVPRAPVVTVMGHVDHGKTSLLDKIRKANVASGEAGGITQHVGAYKVNTSKGTIVFLDTPGHEAFTQMRARGAGVTDLVVLVVAADDGVMPQTKEAVNHAKAAKVPIIVAVNKIDKQSAEPDRVKRELVELGLQPEDWGGDTIFVPVSALTGEGIDQLLEMIGLQSEMLNLYANPEKPASGTVIEALLDRGRGPVARVLVQDGTLRVGDFILAGPGFGKVRAMTNEHGKNLMEAGPSTPVEILGLSDVPGAGDLINVVRDIKKAQEISESRKGKLSKSLIPATARVSLEEISRRIAESGQQELRVIVKADVQGSVEAVSDALSKLTCEKARLSIIHAAVGAITEGDINLAVASKAIVLGFNVRPAGKAGALAEENKIEIRQYNIIYNAIDDVRGAMEGLLPPNLVEKKLGKVEIRQIFGIKNGKIGGCYVLEGQVKRNGNVRVIRDNVILFDGKIAALKRFKDDVKDVQEGFECGISLDGFNDIKEMDIIEAYEIEEVRQKL